MGAMKQVQYWGAINIRRHRINVRRNGDLAPGISARLYISYTHTHRAVSKSPVQVETE
jgi:hypothetical protein